MPEAPPDATPLIYAAMARAAAAIYAVGKDAKNEKAGYAARSIDGVLDEVHVPLAQAGLVLIPNVIERTAEQRTTAKGGVIHYVLVRVDFTFYASDGSSLVASVYGEATDSSDKATNKAMSAALKTALIQTFTIPVNGDAGDADLVNHDEFAEPQASADLLDELAALLAEFHERTGKNYPAVWTAEGYWPLPKMRTDGCTLAVYETVARITRESIAAWDAAHSPGEATPEPDPNAEPAICEECGRPDTDHGPGCSFGPF